MADRLVDTSGDRPSILWGAVATTGVGTVIWAHLQGVVALIRGAGQAFDLAVATFVGFIAGLYDGLFGIVIGAMTAAWAANAEFLATFGVWAPLVAVVEVLAFLAILIVVFGDGISTVEGAFT